MAKFNRKSTGGIVVKAVDSAVRNRWQNALERAAADPDGTVDERVARVRKTFERELTALGAAAGATAAAPGIGTASGIAVSGAELALATSRTADLILAIGAIHGHTDATLEERRSWVLSILTYGDEAADRLATMTGEIGMSMAGVAGAKGAGLVTRATGAVPGQALKVVNRTLVKTVITKYGARRGAVALGKLLPFGVGALIGGGSNFALTRVIGKHAHRFFQGTPGDLSHIPPPAGPSLGSRANDPSIIDTHIVPPPPRAQLDSPPSPS